MNDSHQQDSKVTFSHIEADDVETAIAHALRNVQVKDVTGFAGTETDSSNITKESTK